MKAIINCSMEGDSWSLKYFGSDNPWLLPIVGKPVIEFYLDYCVLAGVDELLVLQSEYDEELTDFLGDGGRWGLKLSCWTSSNHGTEDVISKNTGFIKNAELLMFDGYFFPLYDKDFFNRPANEARARKICENCPQSTVFLASGEMSAEAGASLNVDWRRLSPCESSKIPYITEIDREFTPRLRIYNGSDRLPVPCRPVRINAIEDFYRINMGLLCGHTDSIFMRGYSAESDAFLGMNDVVKTYAELKAPIVIGDNVQIESGARIGSNAIIGNTSIVDMRTRIRNSLVLGGTYIGPDLVLDSKVVAGSKIIDPIEDIVLDTRDGQFTSMMRKTTFKDVVRRSLEIPAAIIIMLPLLLLRIPFLFLGKPKKKRIWMRLKNGSNRSEFEYVQNYGLRDIWFFKLSQDKISKLWRVLSGKMSLIGDTIRDARSQSNILARYKYYSPGAFTYADSLGHSDSGESLIDDLYYRHNRTLRTDLQLLLRSFPSRLLGVYKNEV